MSKKEHEVINDNQQAKNEPAAAEAAAQQPTEAQPQNDEAEQTVTITQEDMSNLVGALKKLMEEKEELEQAKTRLQADFDNFRRRTRAEKEEQTKFANRDLLLTLLPVVDNFERALAGAEGGAFKDGVEMIYRQMFAALTACGLEKIAALDEDFDPELHEAIGQTAGDPEQKGKVVAEIAAGYLYHGKLLRAAMVQVGA
ncbi:MAG: nucleotide exchange factor GrpE [Clostridia bacterium]|nr:nucleotide exchange factor GrpE [Clostridia bacterium]MDD4799300.1 nucleotide exchange factor GrpE [Clostridia bacterium]